ncbi:MAG: zinc-dependent peptidase [Coleofasciculus chthonoplastes F3-SA18-01]|jgi:Mlc titration factor MtfA (ptsG expression regulator)|uniref:M90 family metallopeptidase n=1 Tax=Coleofasciculus chthonoplastes TaxID=64178 RepID=UPI0032F83114
MVEAIIVLVIIVGICAGVLLSPLLTKWRRNRIRNKAFPRRWQTFIEQTLPFYYRLPQSQQRNLQGYMAVFLAEKQFIGCRGLQITEEIKLTIAAQACLLLLNDSGDYYPNLVSILVYPSAYRVKPTKRISDYIVEERDEVRLGESWTRDQLVLSWQQIEYDIQNWQDGHNVVLHEFAHQLDQTDGIINGVPKLDSKADYRTWAQIFTQEYQQLQRDAQRGRKTVMNKYGATDPAEFFAVATETFFEKPEQMARKHTAIYRQLKYYYKLDPLDWKLSTT